MSTRDVGSLIVPRRYGQAPDKKMPRAAFVLSSPRSGSTLLRTMLAGHSMICAPPELRLLSKDRPDSPMPNGVPQTPRIVAQVIAQLSGADPDSLLADVANESAEGLYGRIQGLIGDRLLVDKTPHYAIDIEVLRRAEELFESPLYVWLTRHPAGVIESFRGMHNAFFWGWHGVQLGTSVDRRAEQTWRICNSNIEKFASEVGDRLHVVRYEDMVASPDGAMRDICEFLQVPWESSVLDPYDGSPSRMTSIQSAGDPLFHTHTGIDRSLADSWRGRVHLGSLDTDTVELARRLGYDF